MPGSVQTPQATFQRAPFVQKMSIFYQNSENACVMGRYQYSVIAPMNSYTGIECTVVIILSRCKILPHSFQLLGNTVYIHSVFWI